MRAFRGLCRTDFSVAVWWSQIRPVQDSYESGTATVAASVSKQKNEHAVLVACPCHKAHTVVGHAVKQLSVKIEDYLVDLFYFFHKRCVHTTLNLI